jgi:hypothetical protein
MPLMQNAIGSPVYDRAATIDAARSGNHHESRRGQHDQ